MPVAKLKVLWSSTSRLQVRSGKKGTGKILYETYIWPTFGKALGRVREYAVQQNIKIINLPS
jgi:hypothetical protein